MGLQFPHKQYITIGLHTTDEMYQSRFKTFFLGRKMNVYERQNQFAHLEGGGVLNFHTPLGHIFVSDDLRYLCSLSANTSNLKEMNLIFLQFFLACFVHQPHKLAGKYISV